MFCCLVVYLIGTCPDKINIWFGLKEISERENCYRLWVLQISEILIEMNFPKFFNRQKKSIFRSIEYWSNSLYIKKNIKKHFCLLINYVFFNLRVTEPMALVSGLSLLILALTFLRQSLKCTTALHLLFPEHFQHLGHNK